MYIIYTLHFYVWDIEHFSYNYFHLLTTFPMKDNIGGAIEITKNKQKTPPDLLTISLSRY